MVDSLTGPDVPTIEDGGVLFGPKSMGVGDMGQQLTYEEFCELYDDVTGVMGKWASRSESTIDDSMVSMAKLVRELPIVMRFLYDRTLGRVQTLRQQLQQRQADNVLLLQAESLVPPQQVTEELRRRADPEGQALSGERLKRLWDLVSPILIPILLTWLEKQFAPTQPAPVEGEPGTGNFQGVSNPPE
jgi:hypothetical protein